jgi:peptide/nickel transport system substrate-binding protein
MPDEKKELTSSTITRRKFMKFSAISAGAMMLPVPWASRGWSADGKVLKVRDYSDIKSLDPAFFLSTPEENIMACIYNKLISYKPGTKWEWQLEAAKSIEQVDATHIRFELKPDIKFTHGFGEMTAEDVKFSFERVANPETKSPNKDDWGPLDKVEVTGKYTGVIAFKSPFQPVWWTTLTFASGNIVSKKATEKAGGKFANDPPCFSGPYMLKEWKPSQKTILVKNPDYFGTPAAFDEIQIFPIDDEKTAEIGFEAGDIDFTRVSIASLQNYRSTPPKGGSVLEFPSLYWVWLGMNQDNEKLKDIRVRKAVQMAVDVPSILEAAYFGIPKPCIGGMVPEGLIGYRGTSKLPAKSDIEGAKKLLTEAGHPNGIELTIDVLNKAEHVTMAQVVQATLGQAGIKLQINVLDSGTFWVLGSEKESGNRWKDIQLILNRFTSVPDPSYYTRWYLKDQVGVWNWERFRNDEYDALHVKAMGEMDVAKRNEMYIHMQALLEESGCYRFLTNEVSPVIYRKTSKPALRPDGIPLLRHFTAA